MRKLLLITSLLLTTQIANGQQVIKDLTANKFKVVNTTSASKPCPTMTGTQRDALTPTASDCVFNSTTSALNAYSGSAWVELGAGGGGGGGVPYTGATSTLDLGSQNFLTTGSIGSTGSRVLKGWFTDLQVTNAIAGSITGNAATVTTNANLTGAVTSTGNATLLGSFTSLQLSTALTNETGSGSAVFATSPTLTTPALGVATATSINGTSIPSSKTLVVTTDTLAALSPTTSSQLAGVLSDETGTGVAVFGTAPTFTTNLTAPLMIGGTGTGSSLELRSTSGVGATDYLKFSVGNNGATEAMRITSAGNVGIGTTAPVTQFEIVDQNTTAPNGIMSSNYTNAGNGAQINLRKAGGTPSSPTTTTQFSGIGSINFWGHDGTNFGSTPTAAMQTIAEEAFTTSAHGSSLLFYTTPQGSATRTEKMRMTGAGNLGINTTSPGASLDVKGTIRLSGSSSGYVGLAPASAAGSTTYTLPSSDGTSGQVLSTNGSGTLSWATASGGGSSSLAVTSKTANYTAITTDQLILCNATSGAFTITLPTAVGATGWVYYIKKTDATGNAITINTTSSQTIDGLTSQINGIQYQTITVVSDGSNWHIL